MFCPEFKMYVARRISLYKMCGGQACCGQLGPRVTVEYAVVSCPGKYEADLVKKMCEHQADCGPNGPRATAGHIELTIL